MAVTPRSESRPPTFGASAPADRSHSPWLLILWLAVIASGAATTGLLRADVNATLVRGSLLTHELAGAAVGAFAVVRVLARRAARRSWRAALILGVLAFGGISAHTFVPRWVALHATLAACTAVVVVDRRRVRAGSAPRWQAVCARLALAAMLGQVATGALLRHQLIALAWHLLSGGVAAFLLLVAAVPIVQDSPRDSADRRAAKSAIASLVVQVCLGASIFVMLLVGPVSALAWLGLTAAHVVMGSVTLVAASMLVRDHRATSKLARSGALGGS